MIEVFDNFLEEHIIQLIDMINERGRGSMIMIVNKWNSKTCGYFVDTIYMNVIKIILIL